MITIAVVTATRAEYGNLRPFIKELMSQGIKVNLVVTGTHLSPAFGMTVQEIIDDGFPIAAQIPILVDSDTPNGISKTMALATMGFADYFAQQRPDALLVMGDRYEMMAVCCVAQNEQIPIFHLYGGETTEGAIDEAIRHCISKMSYLHFVGTDEYRRRVIQLGESPNRVFTIGSPAVDNAKNITLLNKQEIFCELGVVEPKQYALLTYHPLTIGKHDSRAEAETILESLKFFPNLTVIATKANADTGGKSINDCFGKYAKSHDNFYLFDSLGTKKYLSLMSNAAVVIGNSSSGLTETAIYRIPTVNIGDRQKGRIHGENVIDCDLDVEEIRLSIERACSEVFKDSIKRMKNPFEKESAAQKAVSVIKDYLENDRINLMKKFYDINFVV